MIALICITGYILAMLVFLGVVGMIHKRTGEGIYGEADAGYFVMALFWPVTAPIMTIFCVWSLLIAYVNDRPTMMSEFVRSFRRKDEKAD